MVWGKVKCIMIVDLYGLRVWDLVWCDFVLFVLDSFWVVDIMYVLIWLGGLGWVYVVFVIDVFVCWIIGWWCGLLMIILFVFDVFE